MPRFMGFVRMEEGIGTPPQALFDAMDAHIGERAAAGVFLDGGGLYGTEDAVNFVVRQGEISQHDGPYAEAKEVIGGWSILQYDTLEEAVADQRKFAELHARYWPEVTVISTLRQISTGPEAPRRLKVRHDAGRAVTSVGPPPKALLARKGPMASAQVVELAVDVGRLDARSDELSLERAHHLLGSAEEGRQLAGLRPRGLEDVLGSQSWRGLGVDEVQVQLVVVVREVGDLVGEGSGSAGRVEEVDPVRQLAGLWRSGAS